MKHNRGPWGIPVDDPAIEEEREMMEVWCNWCDTRLGEKAGPAGTVTHTICERCNEILIAKMLIEGRCHSVRKKGGKVVGELVQHLVTRVLVLWPGDYEATVELPSSLEVAQ